MRKNRHVRPPKKARKTREKVNKYPQPPKKPVFDPGLKEESVLPNDEIEDLDSSIDSGEPSDED